MNMLVVRLLSVGVTPWGALKRELGLAPTVLVPTRLLIVLLCCLYSYGCDAISGSISSVEKTRLQPIQGLHRSLILRWCLVGFFHNGVSLKAGR